MQAGPKSNGRPSVSVIIPTYNCAAYITEAVESVLAQTYRKFEIIVVDDGSTDNTRELLARFMDKIRYIYEENSGGPARPRNSGILAARGTYIAFHDSDDIMLPEKISSAVAFLEDFPDIGMVFTNFLTCDEFGKRYPGAYLDRFDDMKGLQKVRVGENRFLLSGKVAFDALFHGNFVGTSGVMVPKTIFSTIGFFDETVSRGGLEDRDMWFRICGSYDIGYLNIIGHVYRRTKASLSQRGLQSGGDRITVIRRHMHKTRSPSTRRTAKRVIARSFYNIGYQYQCLGELETARKHYFLSIKETFNRPALKGILITLLGRKWFRRLQCLIRNDSGQ